MQYKEHAGIFDCDEYTVRSRERERESNPGGEWAGETRVRPDPGGAI